MSDQYPGAVPVDDGGYPGAVPVAARTVRAKTKKNGKTVYFDVAADADDDAVQEAARKATGDPRTRSVDRGNLPKDTSATTGFLAGAVKPLDNAAEWFASTSIGKAVDRAGQSMGLPSTADAVAGNQAAREGNTRTGFQTLGNIAGTLPTLALPGGALVQGAASGALLSDKKNMGGVAFDAATGAATGKLAQGALSTLGAVGKGVTDKGLRMLNEAGIPLTLGQIASKGKGILAKTLTKGEEALTSVPFLGDVVNSARGRGVEGLNVALGNRILKGIGDSLPAGAKPGHEMVEAVTEKVSARYTRLVPKLRGTFDQQFANDLTNAKALVPSTAREAQFEKDLRNVFTKRSSGSTINGQALKDAESELTRLYGKYKNAQGDEGRYGDALDAARQALRNMVLRSNPSHAKELQSLNKAWAQVGSLRKAIRGGSDLTKATGVVTPGAALRVSTRDGFRDPLLEEATKTLPNMTPDSGTARRAFFTLGGIGAAGGGAGSLVNPALAAPAALSTLYTAPGQKALNAVAFGNRSAPVAWSAKQLENLSRYAPVVTPALVAAQRK